MFPCDIKAKDGSSSLPKLDPEFIVVGAADTEPEAFPLMATGSPRQVSRSQFKAHALELFRQLEASGEPLAVTEHGRPIEEVRPLDEPFVPVGEDDREALTRSCSTPML